jgi:hypothetical protein
MVCDDSTLPGPHQLLHVFDLGCAIHIHSLLTKRCNKHDLAPNISERNPSAICEHLLARTAGS